MISIIIPAYNESKVISNCLESLFKQNYQNFEVIIIDDGSEDNTKFKVQSLKLKNKNILLLSQKHQGPAVARNLGASHAKGDILVFVDADMTFDKDFIGNLISPVLKREAKGTFTKEEYVSNWDNVWARCWNYNENISDRRRIPQIYPDKSPVFRAILKSEFERISGFDDIGFTDDWTLSRKLKYEAKITKDAVCYHENPDTLKDVFNQSRWIGKNEFISGDVVRKLYSLFRYNIIFQTIRGAIISIKYREIYFMVFQFVYYIGLNISILLSFVGESKSK